VRLETRNLAAGYGTAFRVEDVDLVIEDRKITGLIGPNGSGKSTLLKTLARFLKPQRGVVLLDGEILHQLPGRAVAKKLAFLGQQLDGVPDLTVEELAYRGRFPHQSLLRRDPAGDRQSVDWAIGAMRMDALRHRALKTLSHGELRRAWTAMALAQRPDILLLDEPTAFLDLAHQFELMDLLAGLNQHGVTVVLSMHDLWLTALYCHRVIAMSGGRVVASGPTEEVLTPELIREVFGVEVTMQPHPSQATRRLPLPHGRRGTAGAGAPDASLPEATAKDTPSPHAGG
jgi:iron complex transport system ATP-binding protein